MVASSGTWNERDWERRSVACCCDSHSSTVSWAKALRPFDGRYLVSVSAVLETSWRWEGLHFACTHEEGHDRGS